MCSMCINISFISVIIFDDTLLELMNCLDTTVFYLIAHITASLRLLCMAARTYNHCTYNHCSNLP
jgi:hypothetical protein